MDAVTACIDGHLDSLDLATAGSDIATRSALGDVEAVRAWLQNHDVNERVEPRGWTPLEYACYSQYGRIEPEKIEATVALLLENGADPNATHEEHTWKLSALYGASGHVGHAGVVRRLLEAGADPNDGESVPHSVQFNRREILDLLKAHGADISWSDPKWNNTPMYFNAGHIKGGHGSDLAMQGIMWLLENGADPNVTSYDCRETPLHAVCRNGWGGDVVSAFLEHGADANLKAETGWTPTDLAAITGNRSALKALLEAGYSVSTSIPRWYIEAACGDRPTEYNLDDLPKHLQDRGVLKMAENGNFNGLKVLLDLGFDVNAKGEHGRTALHWACFFGRFDLVDLLLAAGADHTAREEEYQGVPMDWALHAMVYSPAPEGDYQACVKDLLAYGADRTPITERLANPELTSKQRELLSGFAD